MHDMERALAESQGSNARLLDEIASLRAQLEAAGGESRKFWEWVEDLRSQSVGVTIESCSRGWAVEWCVDGKYYRRTGKTMKSAIDAARQSGTGEDEKA